MNKRERQRKKIHLTVRFGAERPDKLGLITDVSAHGIYVSSNAVLPTGSVVRLQIQLPRGTQLSLQGRVMRARRVPSALITSMRGGMGIRLEDPPDLWRESLLIAED